MRKHRLERHVPEPPENGGKDHQPVGLAM